MKKILIATALLSMSGFCGATQLPSKVTLLAQIPNASVSTKDNLLTQPPTEAQLKHWNEIITNIGKYVELAKSKNFSGWYNSLAQVSNILVNMLPVEYEACIKSALPVSLQQYGTADYSKIDWAKVDRAQLEMIVKSLKEHKITLDDVQRKLKDDFSVFSKAKDAKELLNRLALTLEDVLNKVSKDYAVLSLRMEAISPAAEPDECGICLEEFDNKQHEEMIMLPCKHIICEQCLKTIKPNNEGAKLCPFCRREIKGSVEF